MIKKWNIVNDQSNVNYDVGNETVYNKEVLISNLCDYNDTYNFVRGDIVTTANSNPTPVGFKHCAPFITCITKIDGTKMMLILIILFLLSNQQSYMFLSSLY